MEVEIRSHAGAGPVCWFTCLGVLMARIASLLLKESGAWSMVGGNDIFCFVSCFVVN